jgi:hypothetical protein
MLVWLPNGKLMTYLVDALNWTLVNETTVIPGGLTTCSQTTFATGYYHVAIMHVTTQRLYVVKLSDFSVSTTLLDYTPLSAVISGVPEGFGCGAIGPKVTNVCQVRGKGCKNTKDCCSGSVCRRRFILFGAKRCR